MKYKNGDRVRIVSKASGILSWTDEVDVYPGKVMTISGIKTTIITGGYYIMKEDNGYWPWYENSIAGLASETPFDFGAWKGKDVCMHCRTREEAEDFCCEMEKAGLTWSSGISYLKMKWFSIYENNTCYCFNEGVYGDIKQAKTKGYTILEWSEYRSTEPPKEEQEKTMELKIDDKPLDFKEAMEIKKRMCETTGYKCENCCIASDTDSCNYFFVNDADEAEVTLKEWAAEHPAKTNRDKFTEVFGKCEFVICSVVPCSKCDWWDQEYIEPNKEQE